MDETLYTKLSALHTAIIYEGQSLLECSNGNMHLHITTSLSPIRRRQQIIEKVRRRANNLTNTPHLNLQSLRTKLKVTAKSYLSFTNIPVQFDKR